MATIQPTITLSPQGVVTAVWTPLANGDVGAPLDAVGYPDKTVAIFGTFGAGGSLTIQGRASSAGAQDTDYTALNDSRGEGNALTFTAADIRVVNENPQFIRPAVTAGDGTTALKCVMTGVARH
jgi:hypothetical protein